MIRYAVIGAGWISQEAFLPAVAQTGNSRVEVLVSGSQKIARDLAVRFRIPSVLGYADYDRLVGSDVIDAVYIALPNSLHADFAIRALRAGKHVLVEKPLATTLEDAQAMIAAAQEAGVFLMTAYRLHTDPATLAVLNMLRQGCIGAPRHFTAAFTFQSSPDNHRLRAHHWGGPLQDIGIYCLNAARHVFGSEPTEVQAMAANPPGDPRFAEIDPSVAVTLRFPEGGLAQFFCSFGTAATEYYRILGTDGEIIVEPGFRFETAYAVTLRTASGQEVHHFPRVDQFAGQIAEFSDCIKLGRAPISDGIEGLADMRALIAIQAALQTGNAERNIGKTVPADLSLAVPRTLDLAAPIA